MLMANILLARVSLTLTEQPRYVNEYSRTNAGLHHVQAAFCGVPSGDAHLSSFGSFAGPDRRLVFGVNDLDETLR
jgi:uncharacterized protein (DUF2252 family)